MISKKIIVAGEDHYNTLGMIRSLGEAGYRFEAVIIKGHKVLCKKSKYLKKNPYVIVDSVDDVVDYLIKKQASFDDKVYLLVEGDKLTGKLDLNYNQLNKTYIWNNACEQGRLTKFLNKYAQVEVAKQVGIKVLPSIIVSNGDLPDNIEYPVITKAVTSEIDNWKSEVFVCNNPQELAEAYKKISSKKVMLQKYIKKANEYCYDGFCINQGKDQFISILSKYNYLLPDEYSFFCTVQNVTEPKIIKEITDFCSFIHFNGIYSFEYIVDEKGELYFMEINFRNSGWSYASTCAGMSLPVLWIEAMEAGTIDEKWIKPIKPGFTFMNETADFRTRVLGKMVSFVHWYKEFRKCDCKLVLGRKDPKPFISYILKLKK